jgi:hypothetical protein
VAVSLSLFFTGVVVIVGTAVSSLVAVQLIYTRDQTARRFFLDLTAARLDAAWIRLHRRWHNGDRVLAVLFAIGQLYAEYRCHKRVTFPGTLDFVAVHSVTIFSAAAFGTELWDVLLRAFGVVERLLQR